MGRDAASVVDSHLKVYGIDNLPIAVIEHRRDFCAIRPNTIGQALRELVVVSRDLGGA